MKTLKKLTSIFIRLGLILLIVILLVVFNQLRKNSDIANAWSDSFARGYQTFFGKISALVPFSLMECLIIALVVFTIITIVLFIIDFVKLKWIKGVSKILTAVLIYLLVGLSYQVSCEFNYSRDEVPLDYYDGELIKSDYKKIVNYFLDDFNYCSSKLTYLENGEVVSPYSLDEVNRIALEEYKKLDDPYFYDRSVKAKPMFLSFLYREFQITGVYFAPFGEVNINTMATNGEIAFNVCHELAHSKGVMRENDAQNVAAFITLNSDDYFFRYSGYINTFSSIFSIINYTGDSNDKAEASSKIDSNITRNLSYINKYWSGHDLLGKVGNWINNLYIKMLGGSGTTDYNDTPITINPSTNEITSLSNYQKLYFAKYYENVSKS